MATLIKERRIVSDNWQLIKGVTEVTSSDLLSEESDVIISLPRWQRERAQLIGRNGKLGIWIDSHEDPALIANDLGHFKLVAVNFPKFGDGRGYSIARLLRERYGWKGELRAIGEVVRDHLFFMAACGFDAFLLREDQDVPEALKGFDDFSEAYQSSVVQPQPLFRRRAAALKAK